MKICLNCNTESTSKYQLSCKKCFKIFPLESCTLEVKQDFNKSEDEEENITLEEINIIESENEIEYAKNIEIKEEVPSPSILSTGTVGNGKILSKNKKTNESSKNDDSSMVNLFVKFASSALFFIVGLATISRILDGYFPSQIDIQILGDFGYEISNIINDILNSIPLINTTFIFIFLLIFGLFTSDRWVKFSITIIIFILFLLPSYNNYEDTEIINKDTNIESIENRNLINITDEIRFYNLSIGREYTLTSFLVDGNTGESIESNSTTFIAERHNDIVEVVFEIYDYNLKNNRTLKIKNHLNGYY